MRLPFLENSAVLTSCSHPSFRVSPMVALWWRQNWVLIHILQVKNQKSRDLLEETKPENGRVNQISWGHDALVNIYRIRPSDGGSPV